MDLRETMKVSPQYFHTSINWIIFRNIQMFVIYGHAGFITGYCKALRGSSPMLGLRMIPETTFQEVLDVPVMGQLLQSISSLP